MPLLRTERTAAIKAPRPLDRPPALQPRLQRIHIRDRNLLPGVDRARRMREVHERPRVEIVHRVRPTVVVQARRFGDHNRVFLAAEILAKGVGVDALDVRLLALVVRRHAEEELAAGRRQLVDGEAHQRREVCGVRGDRTVHGVVVEDSNGGVRFDQLAALDGAGGDHAHPLSWNG